MHITSLPVCWPVTLLWPGWVQVAAPVFWGLSASTGVNSFKALLTCIENLLGFPLCMGMFSIHLVRKEIVLEFRLFILEIIILFSLRKLFILYQNVTLSARSNLYTTHLCVQEKLNTFGWTRLFLSYIKHIHMLTIVHTIILIRYVLTDLVVVFYLSLGPCTSVITESQNF